MNAMARKHVLSAGIVPLREIDGMPRLLLLRCYRYWDFPKGEVGPNEDPLAAAQRETAEETGLTQLDFRWGRDFYETPPYAGGKVARYYIAAAPIGDVTLPISPELGRPEHHEYRWVTLDQAHTLLNERLRAVLAWARVRLEM
jgi:bis(5'-nucleosidyl)-tetraphosphatase